jgi:signal transduction protein with GAF and PtsI domain
MVISGSKSRQRLAALTQIVPEVDSAPDLETALRLLVRRTREVMGSDVCTVYLTDEEKRRHLIAATDGLSPETRLRAAISAVRVATLGTDVSGTFSEADGALFDAYILLLDSPEILADAPALVRQGTWAPSALSRTIETDASRFDAMKDPYLRERATDIRGIGNRVPGALQPPGVVSRGGGVGNGGQPGDQRVADTLKASSRTRSDGRTYPPRTPQTNTVATAWESLAP